MGSRTIEAKIWFAKGNDLYKVKDYKRAIDCYDKALELDPSDAHTWCNKGVVYVGLKETKKALVCYDKALGLDPKYSQVWCNKGVLFMEEGNYKNAIVCFEEAIRLRPDNISAWCNRGLLLGKVHRYEEALVSYNEALRIDPYYTQAWQNKGVLLKRMGRWEEGDQCQREAERVVRKPTTLSETVKEEAEDTREMSVTILFGDVAGSTPIADILSQDEYDKFIREFDSIMLQIFSEFYASYHETYGDGIMVQFFSGSANIDVMRALKTSLRIKERFPDISYNQRRRLEGKESFSMRFGIHTGSCKVGLYPGSDRERAKGYVLNVAKRIEDEVARSSTGSKILLSKASIDWVRNKVSVKFLGQFDLKGITGKMEIWELEKII
ncbi:tetratricopeptide repeat protein [bacterium]|nr:tetratricopeptide repeat protein [bacterium]